MRAAVLPDHSLYPFRTGRVALPEGILSHVDEGDPAAPPVVLVHGTPTWSLEWRRVIPALAAQRRVIAPDHLGFGLSERPAAAGYRPEDHAARFTQFMDRLIPRGAVDLVVHDFGGPIALDWALRNPGRVGSVALVNTWMWPIQDDRTMARQAALVGGWLGRFLYRRLHASVRWILPLAYGDRRRLPPAVHARYLAAFPDADSRERVLHALAVSLLRSRDFYQGLWDRRDRLRGRPLALFWGLRDPAFGPAALHRWQRTFPEAQVVTFPSAGHWPHEEEPDAFTRALSAFLAGGVSQAPS